MCACSLSYSKPGEISSSPTIPWKSLGSPWEVLAIIGCENTIVDQSPCGCPGIGQTNPMTCLLSVSPCAGTSPAQGLVKGNNYLVPKVVI